MLSLSTIAESIAPVITKHILSGDGSINHLQICIYNAQPVTVSPTNICWSLSLIVDQLMKARHKRLSPYDLGLHTSQDYLNFGRPSTF